MRYILYMILCLLTIGLSACSEEEPNNLNGNGKQVTISLKIPGMERDTSPMPYAMPADEDKINTIDVLMFKTDPQFPDDPSKGTYYYRAKVVHTAGSTIFTARFVEMPDNQTIVVLANCRTEVLDLLRTISEGDSKTEVIQALSLAQTTAFDPAGMTGIPMWGEITNQYITTSYNPTNLSVGLTRMLAKINIVNNDASNFTLQEAYLYNPRQKGSVMPDNWDDSNSAVNEPTIVVGAEMTQGSQFSFLTTSAVNKMENLIYTFEADNKSKAVIDRLDATCLVVGGIYQGGTSKVYYRIDLKNYEDGEFFNVLRNHSYHITIISVTDEGVPTPDEAYKGLSNIKVNVEVWNEVTGEVDYGGAGTLYVENRYAWVMLDGISLIAPRANYFPIKTNHVDGLAVKSKPEWITLNTSTVGAGGFKYWHFTATDATTSDPNGREGEIVLQAGHLEYTLYAMQGNCGMNGRPLVQTIGNRTYKTHQYPTGTNGAMECWMVENSKEGIGSGKAYGLDWASANIGSISGDGNPSYRGLENGYYYTWEQRNNACPEGWAVPTQAQWQKLQTSVNNSLQSDESIWWAGPRAAANNAFAGYSVASGTSRTWYNWGIYAPWWSSSVAYQYYRGEVGSMTGAHVIAAAKKTWLNMRCVRK